MTRTLVLAVMGLSVAAVSAPLAVHLPVRLIYNPSDSMARGWYRVEPMLDSRSLRVGDIVLVPLPDTAAALAAQRGYLPAGTPILKRIGAAAPQLVCVRGGVVRIDGDVVATARTFDGQLRPLQAWMQCRRLQAGESFLLSVTSPASFDSRYFGPVPACTVLGVASPMWTWSAP